MSPRIIPARAVRLLCLAAVLAVALSQPAATTLRAAAATHNLFFGTAINLPSITSITPYITTFRSQYSLATAENECKWRFIQPERGVFSFADCDTLMNATVSPAGDGGVFRVHNLCWGVRNPPWLASVPANELAGVLTDHVTRMITRYAGALVADVVNEAVADGNDTAVIFKPTVWYPALPNYVEVAFTAAATARAAAGGTIKLAYNDYLAEQNGTVKAGKVLGVVKGLLAKGIPVDVIGLQCHFHLDSFPSVPAIKATMEEYAKLGVETHITELDIRCPNCTEARLQVQAQHYADLLAACLSVRMCTSFETWGFTDAVTYAGSANAPLPFDVKYVAKPAVAAMLAVLEGTPVDPRRWG